jgi:methionyl-tRNA formyltransferase
MKVILCGYHWTGCKALDLLLEKGHLVYVFTHEAPYHIPSLIDMCHKRGVPYTTEGISMKTLPFVPDIICSIYYRNIIKKDVINVCKGRIFNLHPALLPKYRGCSSLTWALINGEKEVGYTYHYIDEGCDTGKIIIQKSVGIEDWDTQLTLYYRVMFLAMDDFLKAFDMVKSGYEGREQEGIVSYYPRGCPHNGEIDDSWSLEYIERFIRAMYFPPYKPATYKGVEVNTLAEYLSLKNLNK